MMLFMITMVTILVLISGESSKRLKRISAKGRSRIDDPHNEVFLSTTT
jgi:hypothetical protein